MQTHLETPQQQQQSEVLPEVNFQSIYSENLVQIYKQTLQYQNPQDAAQPKVTKYQVLKMTQHKDNLCTKDCRQLLNESQIRQQIPASELVIDQKPVLQNVSIGGADCCAMFMEFAPRGDFGDIVLSHPDNALLYRPEIFKNAFLQMAKGLKVLHDSDIAHNDIKFNNFFVLDYDLKMNKFQIKIADFGYAQKGQRSKAQQLDVFKNKLKTIMAPEILQCIQNGGYLTQQEKSEAGFDEICTDMYAFGVMMFESFTRIPFSYLQQNPQKLKQFQQKQYSKFFQSSQLQSFLQKMKLHCGEAYTDILDVITGLLLNDPFERSTLDELIQSLQ